MKVYLINKETNEVLREFDNVVNFAENYVLYSQQGNLGKIYAMDTEYFTNIKPEIESTEIVDDTIGTEIEAEVEIVS